MTHSVDLLFVIVMFRSRTKGAQMPNISTRDPKGRQFIAAIHASLGAISGTQR